MSQFFWESTQKARKRYFCDRCCTWIERGDRYFRRIWAPPGARHFHVMCEHVEPDCPEEETVLEAVGIELGVAMMVECRSVDVIVLNQNGDSTTMTVPQFVPVLVTHTMPDNDDDDGYDLDEDDIPF